MVATGEHFSLSGCKHDPHLPGNHDSVRVLNDSFLTRLHQTNHADPHQQPKPEGYAPRNKSK